MTTHPRRIRDEDGCSSRSCVGYARIAATNFRIPKFRETYRHFLFSPKSNLMAEVLQAVKSKHPNLAPHTAILATLASQKQVHQLTGAVEEFLSAAVNVLNGQELVDFFNGFVSQFAVKMNAVSLVGVVGRIALHSNVPVSFGPEQLEKYKSQIEKSKDADVLSIVLKAEVLLKKADDVSQCRDELEKVQQKLANPVYSHSLSPSARGAYHLISAQVYERLGNEIELYNHGIEYLKYSGNLDHLELNNKIVQIGLNNENIYDYGNLISIRNFDANMLPVITAVHLGDINSFNSISNNLKNNSNLIKKLKINSLVDLASFHVSPKDRLLSFPQVAAHCQVALEEVEGLVMMTMGKGLITGSINEVEQTVLVDSVNPRMLDVGRIGILRNRVDEWANYAENLLKKLEEITPELLTLA
jgi:hypothetical protein